MFVAIRRGHSHVDGNQFRRRAQTSHDGGHAILAERSNRSADIHDFRRFQVRAERRQHARPRHGHLHRAESKQRMAANVHAPIDNRRDRAGRLQRQISFEQYRADHVSGPDVAVVGPRVDAAALRGGHAVAGKYLLELPDRRAAET